ncbi:MAG: 4'-phosphopantetheinyl transferase family protein [Bryobacteraceae bacterium]
MRAEDVKMPEGVDIWVASLSASDEVFGKYRVSLATCEAERSSKFRFPHLQRSYVIRRGILRELLSSYSGLPPSAHEFSYSSNGKPALQNDPGLHFNLAHSGGMAAYAVTRLAPVGVDIERVRSLPEREAIAARFFAAEECEQLKHFDSQQDLPFFTCWTRKEAFLKATGQGLSRSLQSFAVSIQPDGAARFLRLDGPQEELLAWTLQSFEPAPGYIGALAIKARAPAIRLRHFNPAAHCSS